MLNKNVLKMNCELYHCKKLKIMNKYRYYLCGRFLYEGEDERFGTNNYAQSLFKEFKYDDNDINAFLYSSWCNEKLDFKDFTYLLQGYLDTEDCFSYPHIYLSEMSCHLRFPIKLKSLLEKFLPYPYTETDKWIEYKRQSNVIDILDIIYKYPLDKSSSRKYNFNQLINAKNCNIRTVHSHAVVPSKVRLSDVGYDLTIISKVKDFNSVTALYDTGIQIQVPFGYYVEIVPRSSLSKSGYMLANSMGIVDNSYNGNLYVALTKVAPEVSEIEFPFKCCQLILRKQYFMDIKVQTEQLDMTHREDGGFGSTS